MSACLGVMSNVLTESFIVVLDSLPSGEMPVMLTTGFEHSGVVAATTTALSPSLLQSNVVLRMLLAGADVMDVVVVVVVSILMMMMVNVERLCGGRM